MKKFISILLAITLVVTGLAIYTPYRASAASSFEYENLDGRTVNEAVPKSFQLKINKTTLVNTKTHYNDETKTSTFAPSGTYATGSNIYKTTVASTVDSRKVGWTVPRKASTTYSGNLLTLVFENCGQINGKETRVVVEFTSLETGAKYSTKAQDDKYYGSDALCFAYVTSSNLIIGSDSVGGFNGHYYGGNMWVTYKVSVYAMSDDGGETDVANGSYGTPLYYSYVLGAADIDQANSVGTATIRERVTFGKAFTKYYTWGSANGLWQGDRSPTPSSYQNGNPRTFMCPTPELDTNGDIDPWTKAGVLASTEPNTYSFNATHQVGGNMSSMVRVYSVINSGSVKFQKKSSDETVRTGRFAGIQYRIYKDDGDGTFDSGDTPVDPVVTLNDAGISCDASGTNINIDLEAGTYFAKEIKTNAYYELDEAPVKFTIPRDEIIELDLTDDPGVGTIEVDKTVTSTDGTTPPTSASVLENLTFTLTPQDPEGSSILQAADKTTKQFTVHCGKSMNLETETESNGTSGKVTFTEVPYGTYLLQENAESLRDAEAAATAGGFAGTFDTDTATQSYTVTVGESGTTITNASGDVVTSLTNPWTTTPDYRLKVTKSITGTGSLAGWKFALYDNAECKGTPVGRMTDASGSSVTGTDSSGVVYISGIPAEGTYYLKENYTGTRYTAEGVKAVTVAKTSTNVTVVGDKVYSTSEATYRNTEKYVNLSIIKTETNPDGTPGTNVGGIAFTLWSDSHQAVRTGTTDSSGHLTFEGLSEGTYVLEETGFDDSIYTFPPDKVVAGYDNPAMEITLSGSETERTVSFNNPIADPGNLTIQVIKHSADPDSETLPGYTFEGIVYGVYDDESLSSASKIGEITLNAYGTGSLVYELEVGEDSKDVWVKELSAGSAPYELSGEVKTATANAGAITAFEFEDEPETARAY